MSFFVDMDEALSYLESSEVDVYGERVKLTTLLTVPLESLREIVVNGGSNVIGATPQSGKSNIIGTLCVLNKHMRRPTVVFVGDTVRNVTDMVDNKLNNTFGPFGVKFVSITKNNIRDAETHDDVLKDVRCGKTVFVGISNSHQVEMYKKFARSKKYGVKKLMVLMDEVDTMWTNCKPLPPEEAKPITFWSDLIKTGKCMSATLNQRERALYMLLTGMGGNDVFPVFHSDDNSLYHNVTHCAVHISATHMCTLWWHTYANLGYRFYKASEKMMEENGIIMPRHLKPMPNYDDLIHKRDLFLPEISSKSNGYNMKSDSFRTFMEHFFLDTRPMRMVMVSTTPYVWSSHDITLFDAANTCLTIATELRRCRLICCIAVAIIVTGDGVYMKEREYERARLMTGSSLSDCIEHITKTFGRSVPIVICSYNCTVRCISVRSSNRVLTHAVVAPSKGMNTADVKQLTMRCGGRNTHILRQYGFIDDETGDVVVRVLMTKSDYNTVRDLSNVSYDILERGGTGGKEEVTKTLRDTVFPDMYKDILLAPRMHCKKQIGLDKALRKRHALMFASTEPSELLEYERALMLALEDEQAYDPDTRIINLSRKREETDIAAHSLRMACRKNFAVSVGKGKYKVTEEGVELVSKIRRVMESSSAK